jgi:Archaeal fructose-1,6-bisphosphatase and related enzymes of inositol monophosphatase family
MNNYTEFAMSIAKEAGAFLKAKIGEKHMVSYKGEIDLVTEIDKMSEEMLVSEITGKFPNHDILSEESVKIDRGAEFRWVIDPLDGTTNYAHGYPVFCVSVALEREGEIIVGVIYDPMMEEIFVAEEGKGAFLNGNKILVSSTREITKSLLATGFPYDIRENPDNNINHFRDMALKAQAVRRAGSAALDLAYIAAGRFDGFWELRLKPWDTAAGWLMVKEAGGLVTDIFGKDYCLKSPHILASNGKIHGEMTDTLKRGAGGCSSS